MPHEGDSGAACVVRGMLSHASAELAYHEREAAFGPDEARRFESDGSELIESRAEVRALRAVLEALDPR